MSNAQIVAVALIGFLYGAAVGLLAYPRIAAWNRRRRSDKLIAYMKRSAADFDALPDHVKFNETVGYPYRVFSPEDDWSV